LLVVAAAAGSDIVVRTGATQDCTVVITGQATAAAGTFEIVAVFSRTVEGGRR